MFYRKLKEESMKKRSFLAISVFLFLMSPFFSLANALTVKLGPASVNLPAPGDTFDVDILIEDVADLGSFQFDVDYDSSIVTVENASDVTLGGFLASTGNTATPVGPAIDNVAGKVTYGAFSFGGNPGPNGNGLLATVTFTVQSQTNGALDLNNVQVTDTSANSLAVDTVGNAILTAAAAVPTMTEWGMIIFIVLAGLSSVYYLRRQRSVL